MTLLLATAISGLLVKFLYALVVLLILGALIWAIDTYIGPVPQPIKVVLAVILVICLILWFLGQFPI